MLNQYEIQDAQEDREEVERAAESRLCQRNTDANCKT